MERRCPICGEASMVEAKARTEDASGGGDDLVTFRVFHCESGKCEDTNVFEPLPVSPVTACGITPSYAVAATGA